MDVIDRNYDRNYDIHLTKNKIPSFKKLLTENGIPYEVLVVDLESLLNEEERSNAKNSSTFDYHKYNNWPEVKEPDFCYGFS